MDLRRSKRRGARTKDCVALVSSTSLTPSGQGVSDHGRLADRHGFEIAADHVTALWLVNRLKISIIGLLYE